MNNNSLICKLSSTLQAFRYSEIRNNTEWVKKHGKHLQELCQKYLPHGAGIDHVSFPTYQGLDINCSTENKIFINISFHHMNDTGYYDGWTEHTITVTPCFNGLDLDISGEDRNDIKEYLHDVYYHALTQEVAE